jgi:hypothetical protein
MPTLILWRWLSPTQLSLVPKAGREGLATACLTGAAVVAPAGMAVEIGTVAARVLVGVRSFPLRLHFPSAQRSYSGEMQDRQIRTPLTRLRLPSTNADIASRRASVISPSPSGRPVLELVFSRIRHAFPLAGDRRNYPSRTTRALHPVPAYRYCSL